MKASSIIILVAINIFLMVSLLSEIALGQGIYTTVLTPKGTSVLAVIYEELTPEQIANANATAISEYENALFLSDASSTYNCHSYAWHISEGGNIVWINDPDSYWEDGSYNSVVVEALASKISYGPANHSAITTNTSGYFISKWGQYPLMYHEASDCPYDATDLSYYVKSGDNPAACLDGYSVVGDIARWKAVSEFKTKRYFIEGSNSAEGPWQLASNYDPVRPGWHSLDILGADKSYYRLIEEEVSGKRIVHGIASSRQLELSNHSSSAVIADIEQQLADSKKEWIDGTDNGLQDMGEGQTCVIFTSADLNTTVEAYVADYWRYVFGYTVIVETVDDFPIDPDNFRATLRSSIANHANGGVKYFHLIGDANDWREFGGDLTSSLWVSDWEQIRQNYLSSGYPPNGQPEKEIIPTYAIPDTLPRDRNTAYFTPYIFSDFCYSDVDADSIPDVVVTRWPASSTSDVMRLSLKMQNYNLGYDPDDQDFRIGFFVGDLDHDGAGDGQYAEDVADNIEALLPAGQEVVHLYESEWPVDADRNLAAANLWNCERPELLVIISSYSNRSWPGNFFDQTLLSGSFHMGMIEDDNGHTPLVIAGSCDGADYARTEDPDFGTPIAEKFLFEEGKGAVAWIGPTIGSWQEANGVIVEYIVQEIYSDLSRPIAESWLIAMQRIFTDYQNQRDIFRTAMAYAFLGDPISRLSHVIDPITDSDSESENQHKLALDQNSPNPFNPYTRISFTIPMADLVDIRIYNVAGKLVKKLLSEELPAGRHAISWNGNNDSGVKVASGIYFCRMITSGGTKTRKMVILR